MKYEPNPVIKMFSNPLKEWRPPLLQLRSLLWFLTLNQRKIWAQLEQKRQTHGQKQQCPVMPCYFYSRLISQGSPKFLKLSQLIVINPERLKMSLLMKCLSGSTCTALSGACGICVKMKVFFFLVPTREPTRQSAPPNTPAGRPTVMSVKSVCNSWRDDTRKGKNGKAKSCMN